MQEAVFFFMFVTCVVFGAVWLLKHMLEVQEHHREAKELKALKEEKGKMITMVRTVSMRAPVIDVEDMIDKYGLRHTPEPSVIGSREARTSTRRMVFSASSTPSSTKSMRFPKLSRLIWFTSRRETFFRQHGREVLPMTRCRVTR